jgi:hypothetical protein
VECTRVLLWNFGPKEAKIAIGIVTSSSTSAWPLAPQDTGAVAMEATRRANYAFHEQRTRAHGNISPEPAIKINRCTNTISTREGQGVGGDGLRCIQVVEQAFDNNDVFGLIASFLGPFAYLDLACVCKSFSDMAWSHVLTIFGRIHCQSSEVERIMTRRYTLMPARVLHVRKIAFSLGLNAKGLGLAGTLQLLQSVYPELNGLYV